MPDATTPSAALSPDALRKRLASLQERGVAFLAEQATALAAAERAVCDALEAGGTLFTCGNGGSAAHAHHLEAELVGRYRLERRPLPSVCLGLGPATSTAIANDYGDDRIFARPLRALARPGDVLVAFSTSGTSANVIAALAEARAMGVSSVLVSGPAASDVADVAVRFPGDSADAIQDGHDLVLHALMDAIDARFAG